MFCIGQLVEQQRWNLEYLVWSVLEPNMFSLFYEIVNLPSGFYRTSLCPVWSTRYMNVSDMSVLAFLTLRLFQAVITLYIFNTLFLFCSLWIKGWCCCCCWERVAGARGPAYYRNVKTNMYSCLAGGIWLCGDGWFWSAASGSSKHLWTIPVWNGTVCLCHTCLAIVSQKLL